MSLFEGQPTTAEQKSHMETIRRQCDALYAALNSAVNPAGQPDAFHGLSYAKAEEHLIAFQMWANRAIARRDKRGHQG